MKKKHYLLFAFVFFIILGISAQNMHRDITLNGVTVTDFVNKTIVLKYNPETYDNEYYILASYRQSGATQKNRIAFFRLSSNYSVLSSHYYYNSNLNYDYVINDMIVDTDGNFAFCGNVTISNVTYGLVGKINGTTYAMTTLKRITNENSSYNSICLISNISGTRYNLTGVVGYKQIYSQATYALTTITSLRYDYFGSSFTDNTSFVGSSITDNRTIAVGFVDNDKVNINAHTITLVSSISKQIKLLPPYTIEGDAVIGEISANEYALAIGISDNSTSTSNVGFFLVKLYFDCSGGVSTLNILDQKMYFFGQGKCLVTDVCYDPDEMNICVTGRLIPTLYGRPFIAKINVANFNTYNARYFADGFPDNDSQGYDLNKIIFNPDVMALVSAGNIRFSTINQSAGVYLVEGYGSPTWEEGTCGDENLEITSMSSNRPLDNAPGYTGFPTAFSTLPESLSISPLFPTSNSKCTGFYGYSFRRPIQKIEFSEINIYTTENNTLQIMGAEDGSEYCIYNITGKIVAKGVINEEGIVSFEHLKSGMYLISVINHKTVLKTSKFIRL